MSAQFVDALKGYDYFLSARGRASREEVNRHLASINRKAIAQRTFTHYGNLIDKGFRSYVPINKFDVFQSLGRLQLAADRRRYERHIKDISIGISKNLVSWVPATVIDKSIVGFGLLAADRFPVSPGTQLWIDLEGFRPIPVVVVWRRHIGDQTRIGARAFEFIAKYRIIGPPLEPRATRSLKVLRINEGELYWGILFQVLQKTDELLEAADDLIVTIDEIVGAEVRPARPKLDTINFGSPGEAQIKIDFGIAEILRVLLEKIQFWRDQKRRYSAETDQVELENANIAIETARNAIRLGQEAEAAGVGREVVDGLVRGPLQRALGVSELPDELFEEGSLEEAIVNQRLLPAATDLVAGDDLDFDVEVEDSDE